MYRRTDAKIIAQYTPYFSDVSMEYFSVGNRNIRYLDIWTPWDQPVLMIHGAPWDLDGFHAVLQDPRLHSWYRFIIMDRIGYGKSALWQSEKSIKTHSDIYMQLLDPLWDLWEDRPLVVWHSYGATIALKMVMDYSDKLLGGVVVSGAVDPEHERVFAISHLIKYQPFKFLSWPIFRVANDEKLAHVASLQSEVQNFDDIAVPVHVIHGTADSIVPYENAEYMKQNISEEYLLFTSLEWKDHPLHMSDPEIFVEAIVWHIH